MNAAPAWPDFVRTAVCVPLLLAAMDACAPPPGPGEAIWTVRDGDGGEDRGLDVEVLPEGDIVVVGIDGDPPDDEDQTTSSALIRLYAPDGDVVWDQRREGTPHAVASGVAIDGAGRIVVAGAIVDPDEGWDIWVQQYTADGTETWSEIVSGPAAGEDQAVGVTITTDDVAIVAGYVMKDDRTTDTWVRAYDADGVPQWTQEHDGPGAGFDAATDAAAFGDGAVVVGYETSSRGDTDVWLRAFAADGAIVWTATHDGPASGDDRGAGVAVDADDRVFAVGSVVVPGRTFDAWLGRFDGGTLQWEQLYDGPESLGDGAGDVALGPMQTLVVGGWMFTGSRAWDVWARALTLAGDEIWTHEYRDRGGGDDVVAGVAYAPDGDVVLVGSVFTAPDHRALWLRRLEG